MRVWICKQFQESDIYKSYYDGDVTSVFTPSQKKYWELCTLPYETKTVSLMRNGTKHLFLTMEDLHEWRSRRNPKTVYSSGGEKIEIVVKEGAALRHKYPPPELRKYIS